MLLRDQQGPTARRCTIGHRMAMFCTPRMPQYRYYQRNGYLNLISFRWPKGILDVGAFCWVKLTICVNLSFWVTHHIVHGPATSPSPPTGGCKFPDYERVLPRSGGQDCLAVARYCDALAVTAILSMKSIRGIRLIAQRLHLLKSQGQNNPEQEGSGRESASSTAAVRWRDRLQRQLYLGLM